jgi:basic membrane protein A and related proteins
MKKLYALLALVVIFALVLSGCQQAPAPAVEEAAPAAEEAAPAEEAAYDGKICVVLDSGGVDDKGYNQTAWEGSQTAAAELNWEATYLESRQQTDYEKNINEFLKSDCTLIVSVGFLPGDATKAAAEANPEQKFAIIDYAYDPVLPNVWAQLYKMEEGSFLAGYVAAGATKSGKIGAFGGINIPPVADFFIGFADGMAYYNEQHGTSVEFLGWSNETLDGLFVGDFNDTDTARLYTQNLMDEGVDIILPQSGSEGLAAAATVKERGDVMCVGADVDQYFADTESGTVYLTSIMKHLDLSIIRAARAVQDGSFAGGTFISNLADEGLGLAPFHDFDGIVSDELKAELEQVRQDIIDGKIVVNNWASLSQ